MCRIHHTSQKKHQFTKSEREKAGKCLYTQFDSHKCHSTNLKHHPKRVSQFLWRDKKILGNKRKKRTNMRIKQEIMKWKPSILAAHKVNCKNGTFLPKNPAQLPWVNKSLQLSTWEKTTRRVNLEETHKNTSTHSCSGTCSELSCTSHHKTYSEFQQRAEISPLIS